MEKKRRASEANEHVLANDPLWFKDAIIYELHVRAFFDSDNDGLGDFKGLTSKLDYLQDLGVNTLWLLPFYPSPMRDDGYDIADYRNVFPGYGNRADVRRFISEAHRRGLRVITELVINHTSDQHAWFQAARKAPAGSKKRDFYIWSDTNQKFQETRIIFTDTEKSNWSWDDVAQAYYWHRFFSHQPDLNHNNPAVVKAVIRIMRFWLDMGVDGLRLDAIPYLCVREGTNNENLPETHAVIRQMRAYIDQHYQNRMLLAEANQWPEDVREYFGDGDECHMAYHFPLMPRIYVAVAQEDRHPIVEIMRQTPEIPPNCQWAIFLRNHDELTLEMVTRDERDYMYNMYGADPRARINVGIRRRLAPLMDNNRDKIELVNFLLMTMPGSPIIYYGDEIGMGDNIYLGDRNTVRTPMQWSPDRNAGFSRADPQRLYLPPIMDPVYGFGTVNVESQSRNASSLLHWTRRLISVRKNYQAFGRGSLQFLEPGNRKVLVYIREWQDEILLCVVNLSRMAQPVELDLSPWKKRVPVELLGRTVFPPIGEMPYLLTLKGYGYYGFRLAADVEVPYWHEDRQIRPELPVLVLTEGWLTFSGGKTDASLIRRTIAAATASQLEHKVLASYLATKRWFIARDCPIESIRLKEKVEWNNSSGSWLMAIVEVSSKGLPAQQYFLPMGVCWEDDAGENGIKALAPWLLAKVRQRARMGMLFGAFGEDCFCRALVHAMRERVELDNGQTRIIFQAYPPFAELAGDIQDLDIRRPALEQSNTALFFGSRLFLKGYRCLHEGINPEIEMGRFLGEVAHFPHVAQVIGSVQLQRHDDKTYTLALLQSYVEHQNTGWNYAIDYLERFLLERLATPQNGEENTHGAFLSLMHMLGKRTGEMHHALNHPCDNPDFDPEAVTSLDIGNWSTQVRELAVDILDTLEAEHEQYPKEISQACKRLLTLRHVLLERLAMINHDHIEGFKTRYHGNYHLAQVLLVQNDFLITDFEGNPEIPLAERRSKHSPLKDVASMLCCFSYASAVAVNRVTSERPEDRHRLGPWAQTWENETERVFLEGYRAAISCDPDQCRIGDTVWPLLDLLVIEKNLKSLQEEMQHRPDWLPVPLFSLLRRLEAKGGGSQ